MSARKLICVSQEYDGRGFMGNPPLPLAVAILLGTAVLLDYDPILLALPIGARAVYQKSAQIQTSAGYLSDQR